MSLTREDLEAIANLLDEKLEIKLDDKLKPIEERLTSLEGHVGKIEVVIENDIKRNIQLLAENHLELNKKYNEAIHAQSNTLMLEVKLSGFIDRLEMIEKELLALKSRIA